MTIVDMVARACAARPTALYGRSPGPNPTMFDAEAEHAGRLETR